MAMEVNILESEKNKLKVELVGKTHTLANIITKELWNDKDVEVAGYNVMHPQTSNAILVIETKKKDAKKVLLDTIKNLNKKSSNFVKLAKKAF